LCLFSSSRRGAGGGWESLQGSLPMVGGSWSMKTTFRQGGKMRLGRLLLSLWPVLPPQDEEDDCHAQPQ